jgi:hypothetical protein
MHCIMEIRLQKNIHNVERLTRSREAAFFSTVPKIEAVALIPVKRRIPRLAWKGWWERRRVR